MDPAQQLLIYLAKQARRGVPLGTEDRAMLDLNIEALEKEAEEHEKDNE